MGLLIAALMLAVWMPPPCQALDLDQVAAAIVAAVNQQRAANNVAPLKTMPYLTAAALGHSKEMLKLDYFSHTSPTPGATTPRDRIHLAGGKELACAENIYTCQGFEMAQVAERAMDAFIHSPTHYHNLMNPKYNRTGVGVATDGRKYYVTQVFSYLSIYIPRVTTTSADGGLQVSLSGTVVDGPTNGAIFYAGHSVSDWSADSNRQFSVTFDIPGPGTIEVGQSVGDYRFTVNEQFKVGSPQ